MNVGWASSGWLWLRLSPAEAPSAEWGAPPPKQLMTAPLSARPQSLPQGHDTLPQDE